MNTDENMLMNPEENTQPANEPTPGNAADSIEKEDCECISKKSTTDKTGNEITTQKEAIEILKVELVTPGSTQICDADSITNLNDGIVPVIENQGPPLSLSNSEKLEVVEDKQSDKTTFENTQVERGEKNGDKAKIEVNVTNLSPVNNENNEPQRITTISGLSLLAQYQSDDDTESVVEVPMISAQDYRNQVVEIDSDSDSGDSSDSSDVEYLNELRKTIEKQTEVVEDDDDEDDNGNTNKRRQQHKLRVKGEMLLEDLPPIQDLQITVPEEQCIEFGKIHSIVDQLVLVVTFPNSILLDLETVMFLEKGKKVLGEVFDVLGQVADPLYCVRFNSNKQIKEKQINIGDLVYVAPKTKYTQYVILSSLMKLKGSDASWENDMEPPPRFLDYSDDEQEQLARKKLRNKERPIDNEDPSKRSRTADDAGEIGNRHHGGPHTSQKMNRGPVGSINSNARPRYNGPRHNIHQVHHHRSSWHSNYYPQSLQSHPSGNYGFHSTAHNTPHVYQPHTSAYAMPPINNMPYPTTQPTEYSTPTTFPQHSPQQMSNTFAVRHSTLHRPPHTSLPQQYSSIRPPPGSQ